MQFCSHCGTKLLAKEGLIFCQFCGAPLEKDATFCSQCGKSCVTPEPKLQQEHPAEAVSGQPAGKGQETETIWLKLSKNWAALRSDKKKFRTLLGGVLVLLLAGGGVFYAYGPTEHHVAVLAQQQDSAGLVRIVAGRAHSSLFSQVTHKAVMSIIDLGNKEAINSLSKFIVDKDAELEQKKAIITAFTEKDKVVPYFYQTYAQAGQVSNLLIENGTKQNPAIFQDKVYGDMSNILEQCKQNFTDYDQQIEDLKIFNVGDFTPETAFINLKSITKLYAIQQALKTNDSDTVLKFLDQFKSLQDAPLIAKNADFFTGVTNRLQTKQMANSNIKAYNSELANLDTAQKVAVEESAVQKARDVINGMDRIKYFGENYMGDGRLAIFVPGSGFAVITNPRENFRHGTFYSDYVERKGTTTVYDNYGSYNVPMYEIKNVTPYLDTIRQHQKAIRELYAAEQEVKEKIAVAAANRDNAETEAGEMLNGMLEQLNGLQLQDILDFSSGKAEPPIFATL